MRCRRAAAGLTVSGLALVAVAGCGSGDQTIGRAPSVVSDSGAPDQVVRQGLLAPDRVTVRRPAFLDTDFPAASLPVWPGPDPAEFLLLSPPEGSSGELAGDEAAAVYWAARDNPDSLWNVGGIVVWLTVTPA